MVGIRVRVGVRVRVSLVAAARHPDLNTQTSITFVPLIACEPKV
jgi:hypothetical protein